MRLANAVTYFLDQWPAEGPPVDTVRTYRAHLTWLVAYTTTIGKVYLADLTPDLLRQAMAAKMVPPASRKRRSSTHAEWKDGKSAANGLAYAARKMARWLATQGVPVANLDQVKPPRPPERVQPRLRAHEFRALENAVLHRLVEPDRRVARLTIARDLALIHLLADTGLRAYEVCNMEVRHVDLAQGNLTVYGKGQRERSLSLVDADDPRSNTTLHLLAEWVTVRSEVRSTASHSKLWVSSKGRPLSRDQLRVILNGLCREAGIDNRPPHTFRRGSFTEHYRTDPSSLSVLAARMGWSKKSHHMVDVYTRGAEVDLARETPVPSLSERWRQTNSQLGAVGEGTPRRLAADPTHRGARQRR